MLIAWRYPLSATVGNASKTQHATTRPHCGSGFSLGASTYYSPSLDQPTTVAKKQSHHHKVLLRAIYKRTKGTRN